MNAFKTNTRPAKLRRPSSDRKLSPEVLSDLRNELLNPDIVVPRHDTASLPPDCCSADHDYDFYSEIEPNIPLPPRAATASDVQKRKPKADKYRVPTTGARAKIKYAMVLNLGGERYHIKDTSLARAEGTLLGELNKDHPAYDSALDEFFFDRSPGFFPFLLDHLDGGVSHFPHCLCPQNLINELEFWKIDADILPACCNTLISNYLAEQETIKMLEKTLIKKNPYNSKQWCELSNHQKLKAKIYQILDDPDSSKAAWIWVVGYTVLVLLSIAIACLATVPQIRMPVDATHCAQYTNTSKKQFTTCATIMPSYMWWTSTMLNVIFFFEICIKFYVYPFKKYKFFLNFLNLMDIIAVVLTLSTNVLQRVAHVYWQNNIQTMTSLGAIASVLKVGRMTQFVKHNRGLKVLVLTLKFSKADLLVLLFLMLISMLLYSVAIYIIEYNVEDMFFSIPDGMWWSLVTMTTVGYNDMRPSTALGFTLGSVCALIGVIITGAAIPLTANAFEKLTDLSRQVGTKREPPDEADPCTLKDHIAREQEQEFKRSWKKKRASKC